MAEKKQKETVKAPDLSISSGEVISFASKQKALVLLSKVWSFPVVGIFVDVPLVGTPFQRFLIGLYGLYAFEKTAMKMFNTSSLGPFNYRMRKDGVCDYDCRLPVGTDGAPTMVRLQLTAKPHRAGVILGNILAKAFFEPASSDLSTPLLEGFPKDRATLLWTASKFLDAIPKADIVFIGAKATSIKANIKKKFDKAFAKVQHPDLSGAKAPSPDHEHPLMKESLAVEYKGKVSPATQVIVAQVLASHGTVGVHGDTITLCSDPDQKKYAVRISNANLESESRILTTLHMYERLSSIDKASKNSLPTILAIAGIVSGLPIEVGEKVMKSKEIERKVIVKECAKLVSDSKK